MLRIPTAFALVFVVLGVLHTDMARKRTFKLRMEELSQQIEAFQKDHKHLPSQEAFLKIKLSKCGPLLHNFHYDTSFILPDSPDQTTVLAHAAPNMRILPKSHIVLYKNYNIGWVDDETLAKLRNKQKQFYLSRTIN